MIEAKPISFGIFGPAAPVVGNAIAAFDGTTGRKIKSRAVTIDDDGNITLPANAWIGPVKEQVPIPIEWALDGASPPDAVIILTSTFKVPVREFRGSTGNQDVYISWPIPKNLIGGAIKFRVRGWVTNATAPADTETIIFTLAGSSVGNSELLSKSLGAAISSTFTADAAYVQYDRWTTAWSGDVTITDLAADEDLMFQLIRDQGTDTYGQKAGISWLDIEYSRRITND